MKVRVNVFARRNYQALPIRPVTQPQSATDDDGFRIQHVDKPRDGCSQGFGSERVATACLVDGEVGEGRNSGDGANGCALGLA